jgi:hypothetical protein
MTVHADYICSQHANHANSCKWYLAANLDLDDAVGSFNDTGLKHVKFVEHVKKLPNHRARNLCKVHAIVGEMRYTR